MVLFGIYEETENKCGLHITGRIQIECV